jgi:hypothetical protein
VHDDEVFQTKLHEELAHILKQYGAEILKSKEEECEEIHYSKKQLCMNDLKSSNHLLNRVLYVMSASEMRTVGFLISTCFALSISGSVTGRIDWINGVNSHLLGKSGSLLTQIL